MARAKYRRVRRPGAAVRLVAREQLLARALLLTPLAAFRRQAAGAGGAAGAGADGEAPAQPQAPHDGHEDESDFDLAPLPPSPPQPPAPQGFEPLFPAAPPGDRPSPPPVQRSPGAQQRFWKVRLTSG